MAAFTSQEVLDIAWLTMKVTCGATLIGAVVGIPIGAFIGLRTRPTLAMFRILLYTFYSLPPVIAGLVGYLLLTRSGPLGGLGLLFTPTAIIIVESFLAIPLIAGLTVAALAEVPQNVREAIHASGASSLLRQATLIKEARFGIYAAIMVGWGRALAEVAGATIVGGNIRHETRTLGTAILQVTGQGDFSFALALGGVLLAMAFATVLVLVRLQTWHTRGETR